MDTRLSNEHGRRHDLARFGYRSGDLDLAAVWRLLRSDFSSRAADLELSHLTGETLAIAQRYCGHRAALDQLMDRCDEIHLEIFKHGPERQRVETYANARDQYEDAVEQFGELRIALQKALAEPPRD